MTNEELMKEYVEGRSAAFDELFERIHRRVYAYVTKNLSNKNECEDVAQNIFIKLHMSKERYNATYPFDAWLFTIARSVLYDHLRKSSRLREEEFKDFCAMEELSEIDLEEKLQGLNEKGREAVKLKYMDDLTFEEIAQKIKTSPANVRQIISRAIRFLRKENEVKNGN